MSLCGSSQQSDEAFLFEVPVRGQGFGETTVAHEKHRAAIGEAVALVETSFVQCKTSNECVPAHRDNRDLGIVQNRFDHLNRRIADMLTFVGQCIQELSQYEVSGEQATRTQGFGDLNGFGVVLIEGICESDPIDSVCEQALHSL